MCSGLALLCGTAVADGRLYDNEVGRGIILCSGVQCSADGGEVIAVLYSQGLEAEGLHALLHILSEGDIGGALDGNAVGIIENGQLVQLPGAGQRQGLGGDALHQTAVAAEGIGAVVDDFIARTVENACQMLLGSCHTDRHGETGAQGARGGFYADGVAVLGMTRCERTELTELHQVLLLETELKKMQQRVEQHGAVAAGENEAVPILPGGILGIYLQMMCPELIGHGSGTQGKTGVTGLCLLNRIG